MATSFSVRDQISRNTSYLDFKKLAAMSYVGSIANISYLNCIKLLKTAASWRKRWNHLRDRYCLTTEVAHTNFYLPYVWSEEEGVYLKKLVDLRDVLYESSRSKLAHCDFFCLFFPYE